MLLGTGGSNGIDCVRFQQTKDTLEETYDEWKANAESRIPDLERARYVLHKVDIDVDELLRWCDSQGCPVDGEARSLFAAAKLREMDR